MRARSSVNSAGGGLIGRRSVPVVATRSATFPQPVMTGDLDTMLPRLGRSPLPVCGPDRGRNLARQVSELS